MLFIYYNATGLLKEMVCKKLCLYVYVTYIQLFFSFLALASAIPLTDNNHELLPIQFSIDPGDREDYGEKMQLSHSDCIGLLNEYLDVLRIDVHVSFLNLLLIFIKHICAQFFKNRL